MITLVYSMMYMMCCFRNLSLDESISVFGSMLMTSADLTTKGACKGNPFKIKASCILG